MMAVAGFEEIFFNQVSDDFGIGFSRELVAFFDELFLQAEVVLDDAIMSTTILPVQSRWG